MKVSPLGLSPDIIPSGWLGSKHQLTNYQGWKRTAVHLLVTLRTSHSSLTTNCLQQHSSKKYSHKKSQLLSVKIPQWGAADAEIKVLSGENTELKRYPCKAWSRSVYSHTCYAYCQGLLPCLFLPFQSIHLHFFQNLSQVFLCWLLWLTPVPV